ncbi:potassium/sodium hyperpolarization-activated cyclic nucleotide-gated channel 1-like [Tenebrio molitor]|uniref:potassium/sodium hyperpolarization-activated cyclic nucleotide-gated channel 1-like n=1 Tax=Tenebrio molitor TaxID=7067 RepID=UPI0036248C7E
MAAMRKEKQRHLNTRNFKYVIHPLSKLLVCKRIVMIFAWFSIFVADPFLGTFHAKTYLTAQTRINIFVEVIMGFINLILLVDVVIRFFTGYIVPKTREIVLDQRRVLKHYITGYLFVDTFPGLVSLFLCLFRYMSIEKQILIFQLKYIRFVRLKTLLLNFDICLKLLELKDAIRIISKIALVTVLVAHWWTCFLGLIPIVRDVYGIPSNDSWLVPRGRYFEMLALNVETELHTTFSDNMYSHYAEHLEMVLCHFYGAGVGYYKTEDAVEMFTMSLILVTGLIFNIMSIAYVLQLFGSANISETKFDELLVQTKYYMHRNRFPGRLRRRVLTYYSFKFNQKFFSEQKILDTLSEHLRMEILLYSCRNLVENVQIFKGLSKAAVGSLLALLHQEIYLPKDQIMSSEGDKGKLFFVLYGTCGLQALPAKELTHIEDGDHFGDVGLIRNTQIQFYYRVVALEASEVYSLQEEDLHFCCSNHPEIVHKLFTIARAKEKVYAQMMGFRDDPYDSSDILQQLRNGKILMRGMRRHALLL